MKNFTFLLKRGSSLEIGSRMIRKRFENGSPNLLAVLILFLLLFPLNVDDVKAATSVARSVSDIYGTVANGTQKATLWDDGNVTISVNSDGNNGKIYDTGTSWRLYHSNSAVVTVSLASGSLSSVTFTFSVSDKGKISYSSTKLTSGTAVSVSGTSATFTVGSTSGSKGKVNITSFTVVYTSSCAGTQLAIPDVTVTPASGQVQLSWPDVTSATKYKVSWNGEPYVDATSPYTKTSLTNGTAYKWAVKAIGNGSTYCNSESNEGITTPNSTIRTVTWKVNGETYATTKVASGDHLVLPASPSSCAVGKEFAGWSASTISGTTDTKPTFVSSQTTISADQTYHAVFATRTANSYTKGDINDLFPGQTVLIVNTSNNKAVSDEYVSSNQDKKLKKVDVTISSNTITSMSNSHLIWTVENRGLKYNFKTSTGYLRIVGPGTDMLSCNIGADSWSLTANTGTYYMNSSNGSTSRLYYNSSYYYFTTNGNNASGTAYAMAFFVPTYSSYATSCGPACADPTAPSNSSFF